MHFLFSNFLKGLFLGFGVISQYFGLLVSNSPQDTIAILYSSIACLNGQWKGLVCVWKKREIVQLWQRLNDEELKAVGITEFKHLQYAYTQIKIVNYYQIVGALHLAVFVMMPCLTGGHHLPTIMWFPFDPYKSTTSFVLTYIGVGTCVTIVGGTNLVTDMCVLMVFICLQFFYALLNERAKQVGHRSNANTSTPQTTADIYREMIDLINFHLKVNEYTTTFLDFFVFLDLVSS